MTLPRLRTYQTAVTFAKVLPTATWTSGDSIKDPSGIGPIQNQYIRQHGPSFTTGDTSQKTYRIKEDINSVFDRFAYHGTDVIDIHYDSVFDNKKYPYRSCLLVKGSDPNVYATSQIPSSGYGKLFNYAFGCYIKIPDESYIAMRAVENQNVMGGGSVYFHNVSQESSVNNAAYPLDDLLGVHFCTKDENLDFCVKITIRNFVVAVIPYDLESDKWYHFLFSRDWGEDKDYNVYRLYIDGKLCWMSNQDLLRTYFETNKSRQSVYTDLANYATWDAYKKAVSKYKYQYLTDDYLFTDKNNGSYVYFLNKSPILDNPAYYDYTTKGSTATSFYPSKEYFTYTDYLIDDIFLCNDYLFKDENFELPKAPFIEEFPDGVKSDGVLDIDAARIKFKV